ncbi:MAG TPA: hypothetical protein VKR21_05475 [Solirubrobacteraceae bacterium]|nr:hypothetical protein [Solirubrobacteraceae bacterium]
MADSAVALAAKPAELPELAAVWWRPRVSESRLNRVGWLWTLVALAHSVPFLAAAVALSVLKPVTIPIGVVLLVHAWAIPELYAARGAAVLKRRRGSADAGAERAAIGLLGDLLGHRARELRAQSGLAMERGRFGVWVLGEAGALLVRPGGHRVHCYCVGVADPDLPPSDRTAHLLLALREDETGFATVANLAFAGATWRVRRRLAPSLRGGLAAAVQEARAMRNRPA